jgi:hypothetical protein
VGDTTTTKSEKERTLSFLRFSAKMCPALLKILSLLLVTCPSELLSESISYFIKYKAEYNKFLIYVRESPILYTWVYLQWRS